MANNFMNKGVTIAIAILVVAIITAALIPSAIGSFNENNVETKTQTVDNSTDISVLISTVESVDDLNNQTTVTLNKTGESYSSTQTLDLNVTTSYTYDGDTMDVTLTEIQDSNTVVLEYEYPSGFGWDNASKSLFMIIPLFLIMAILMFVVGYAKIYR